MECPALVTSALALHDFSSPLWQMSTEMPRVLLFPPTSSMQAFLQNSSRALMTELEKRNNK